MSKQQERLVRKGGAVNASALLQLGQVSLGLVEEHRSRLFECGFSEDAITRLRAAIDAVQEGIGKKSVRHEAARHFTRRQEKAVDDAKELVRCLRLAVPLAMEDLEGLRFTEKSFHSGRLGRSTPRIVGYLDRIRGYVEVLDARLAPYLKGESALARLDALSAALGKSDATQEVARGAAPLETGELNANKGRLLELIERLHRIARIAFAGEPHHAAKFNKGILLRARRARAGARTRRKAGKLEGQVSGEPG